MRLERRKLVALANALETVGNLKGIKFAYGVAKNLKKLTDELELLGAGLKQSKRFKEYNKKRIELCNKHAKQDGNGKPIMVPVVGGRQGSMEYVGLIGNDKFDKEIETLRAEYKSELDEREEAQEKYDELLDEKTDFEFYMIQIEDIPQDITTGQMSEIIDLVVGEEEEAPKVEEPTPEA